MNVAVGMGSAAQGPLTISTSGLLSTGTLTDEQVEPGSLVEERGVGFFRSPFFFSGPPGLFFLLGWVGFGGLLFLLVGFLCRFFWGGGLRQGTVERRQSTLAVSCCI